MVMATGIGTGVCKVLKQHISLHMPLIHHLLHKYSVYTHHTNVEYAKEGQGLDVISMHVIFYGHTIHVYIMGCCLSPAAYYNTRLSPCWNVDRAAKSKSAAAVIFRVSRLVAAQGIQESILLFVRYPF